MKTMSFVMIGILVVSLVCYAGSWDYLLLKVGTGTGVVCTIESKKSKLCTNDEANEKTGCVLGETLVLLAVPGKKSTFKGWRGDCISDTPVCEMTCDKRVVDMPWEATARFEKKESP